MAEETRPIKVNFPAELQGGLKRIDSGGWGWMCEGIRISGNQGVGEQQSGYQEITWGLVD